MIRHYDPFNLFDRMTDAFDFAREFDTLFDLTNEMSRNNIWGLYEGEWSPRLDMFEDDDASFLKVDVPGVSKDNLDINFNRGELTITGRREIWDRGNLKSCYCERFDGHYRRVFTLDNTLNADKIDAKLMQGVLELTIPKVEAVKPKKIEIKTS